MNNVSISQAQAYRFQQYYDQIQRIRNSERQELQYVVLFLGKKCQVVI